MENRSVASSLDGFIHYLVTGLICRGYRHYVTGVIPDGKDATKVDAKLLSRYGADVSTATRWRRKKNGYANIKYLRYDRFFVLIATTGVSDFFKTESDIKDIHVHPIRVGGYSISFRKDSMAKRGGLPDRRRVHVRIEDNHFMELLAEFEHYATRMSAQRLMAKFYNLPYRGYAPVRTQLCQLLRAVNKRRKKARKSKLPKECLFLHRKPVKVFELEQNVANIQFDFEERFC